MTEHFVPLDTESSLLDTRRSGVSRKGKKKRQTSMRRFAALALTVAAALAATATAAAHQRDTWYWTEQRAADLVYGGIYWPAIGRHDHVTGDTCWGLGDTYNSGGQIRYRHFYCTVKTTNDRPYAILMHVLGRDTDTIVFDDYITSTWYWSAQRVANALVVNGIRWPGGHDRIQSDACTSFGKIYRSLYQHFYCLVDSASTGARYATLVDVLNRRLYRVTYIDVERKPAPPVPGQRRALVEQGNATLTQMTLQTTHFNNQYLFGTPYPPPFGPPSGP